MYLKILLLIGILQFIGGFAFAQQVASPASKSPSTIVKDEEPVYDLVDEPAEFRGGTAALENFINSRLIYPETAMNLGLEGKCDLQFVVTKHGDIKNVIVEKGVLNCPECDKEAIRVVKSMPKWKPGKIKGENVNSRFSLPVSFKL